MKITHFDKHVNNSCMAGFLYRFTICLATSMACGLSGQGIALGLPVVRPRAASLRTQCVLLPLDSIPTRSGKRKTATLLGDRLRLSGQGIALGLPVVRPRAASLRTQCVLLPLDSIPTRSGKRKTATLLGDRLRLSGQGIEPWTRRLRVCCSTS